MKKKYYANHCWHWSRSSEAVRRPQEKCCNCGKIIEEEERWKGDPGKCEWEELE